jgi:hypothetical protein
MEQAMRTMRVKVNQDRLNGYERQDFHNALLQSFNTPIGIQQFLTYQLDKDINQISAPVVGVTVDKMWFDVISEAETKYWSGDLLLAARKVSPQNPQLLEFARRFQHGPEIELDGHLASPLEVEVVATNAMVSNPAAWRSRLGVLEAQVCQVEVAGQTGTGFLVGPSALMTNYHVLRPLLDGDVGEEAVAARFDFRWDADGNFQAGTVYRLADDWHIDASPPSPVDEQPPQDGVVPDPEQLDYAIVRLAPDQETGLPPGKAPLAKPNLADPKPMPERGCIPLPEGEYGFAKETALHILQHPGGNPIKLALDTSGVLDVDKVNGTGFNGNRTRVRYRTNTGHGSSGSPCFDAAWNLIALHHAGDPNYPKFKKADYNQGVPISRIRERLGDKLALLAT